MVNEMKPWQCGFELDYLKSLEEYYKDYNSFAFSPFAQYKKNSIAKDLNEGNFKIIKNTFNDEITATAALQTVKASSDITLYQNVLIGRKEPTDVVVSKLQGISYVSVGKILDMTKSKDTWVYVWAEDYKWKHILLRDGFEYVGPKVTSFGEIYSIYFRNNSRSSILGTPRIHPKIDPIHFVSCKQISSGNKLITDVIQEKLKNLNIDFTNHYSNYNAKKSWSALSLRGYSHDPSFITKPSEMNDKWKEKHKDEQFELQDTPLYDQFSFIRTWIPYLFGGAFHRIRFMKLEPGGGELKRHTDLVDIDSGLEIGKLARIHIPIITNENVEFTVWDLNGQKRIHHMKEGEMWVLDTRKPHKVVNNGLIPRIHLVIDVQVDEMLYNQILKG